MIKPDDDLSFDDDDLSFDDYMEERIINEVLYNLKSSFKGKRALVLKKRAYASIVEKEANFSAEKKRPTPSSNKT